MYAAQFSPSKEAFIPVQILKRQNSTFQNSISGLCSKYSMALSFFCVQDGGHCGCATAGGCPPTKVFFLWFFFLI